MTINVGSLAFIKSEQEVGLLEPVNIGFSDGGCSVVMTPTAESRDKLKLISDDFSAYSYCIDKTVDTYKLLNDFFLQNKIDNSFLMTSFHRKNNEIYICLENPITDTEFQSFLEKKILDSVGIKSNFIPSIQKMMEIMNEI